MTISKANSGEEPDKTGGEDAEIPAESPHTDPKHPHHDHPYLGGPYHDEGDGLGGLEDEENP